MARTLVLLQAVTRWFIPVRFSPRTPFCSTWLLAGLLSAPATPPCPERRQRFPGCSFCPPAGPGTSEKPYSCQHSPRFVPLPVFNQAFFALSLVFPCQYFCLRQPGTVHASHRLARLLRPWSPSCFFSDVTRERAQSQRLLYFISGTRAVPRGRVTNAPKDDQMLGGGSPTGLVRTRQ